MGILLKVPSPGKKLFSLCLIGSFFNPFHAGRGSAATP